MKFSNRVFPLGLVSALFFNASVLFAAVPAPEKLLPDDTLFVLTAPDFSKLSEAFKKSPQAQAWNDPALKPFREKFEAKWKDEVVQPLERELGIKFADYTSLLQGQVTLAFIQNGWKGHDGDQEPGVLLLVDARDRSGQLKKNLADLRKKWVERGKTLRTEKVRDLEFMVVPVSSNDVPKTLTKLFPKSGPAEEGGDEKPRSADKNELVVGQADSLLILGNTLQTVEQVVIRLKGGSAPALADYAPYQANHLALFRNAPIYGWVNVKRFMDIFVPIWSEKKQNTETPSPFDFAPDKILNALGISGLKTIAFSAQQSGEGNLFQVFFSVPESARQGLFKILAGEPKEATPPPFVPADAVKFQRWRIDGQKAWATLEKTLSDISPQAVSTLNFLLDSANNYAREKDPGFDIRKNLIGNLGDDIITYEKAPRGQTVADVASPPSVFLLGSGNPEQLVGSLKGILVFLSQQAGAPPQEREFLGRKLYSVPISLPGRPMSGKPTTLSYAATAGYVAFSTDAAAIEEYLRTSDSPPRPLRSLPGLTEASQKVIGPNSSLFGYQNDAENMRASIELFKNGLSSDSGASASGLEPLAAALGGQSKIKDWLDFSLLPSFDKIAKYFAFSVYGGGATVDGLSLKMYSPTPPALRH